MSILALVAAAAVQSPLPFAEVPGPTPPEPQFRLTEPIYDDSAVPGHVFARGDRWKADFGPSGVAMTPVLGQRAGTNQTHSFQLASIQIGGEPLGFAPAEVHRQGAVVSLERGAVEEQYHVAFGELEQRFVFRDLPGRDTLTVEVAVDTPWTPDASTEELRFISKKFGTLAYGRAFAFDATGALIELERAWTGDSIRLTVPATFVESAVLPLTIDPTIGFRLTFNSDSDERKPDVTYDDASDRYWFVWEEFVSLADVDCFVRSYSATGGASLSTVIDLSGDRWLQPAIAAAPASNVLLVVAVVQYSASNFVDVRGRRIDSSTSATLGGAFTIDETARPCASPDVGGARPISNAQSEFCVVWQRQWTPGNHDIQARLVDADGTFPGGTIFLSNAAEDNDFAPAVSQSIGDANLPGDVWNVAWIRDDDGNGWGQPWARRIDITGQISSSVEFLVFNTQLARNVDVTSTMSDTLGDTGRRPYLVCFERNLNRGDVYVSLCARDTSYATNQISSMEDFDVSLEQSAPRIASDGTNFLLTYVESSWSNDNGVDTDVFMLSGGVGEAANDGYIALGERHRLLDDGTLRQADVAVCTQFDGGRSIIGTGGMAVWIAGAGITGGFLRGFRLDVATSPPFTNNPVGLQYCEANPHADSEDGGRRSSWLAAFSDDQSIGSLMTLRCTDMKRDAFGYFLCSLTTGDVNMPGGSAGRLCLGGDIGRSVGGTIGSTGPEGELSVIFTPTQLPQPTGVVSAAPGETWAFQCWHRDVQNGAATSNFSNGCRVRFRP